MPIYKAVISKQIDDVQISDFESYIIDSSSEHQAFFKACRRLETEYPDEYQELLDIQIVKM